MGSRQLRCPKCANRMEEGFIVDVSQANQLQSQWVQGKPEKSFWTGIKTKGRSRRPVSCRPPASAPSRLVEHRNQHRPPLLLLPLPPRRPRRRPRRHRRPARPRRHQRLPRRLPPMPASGHRLPLARPVASRSRPLPALLAAPAASRFRLLRAVVGLRRRPPVVAEAGSAAVPRLAPAAAPVPVVGVRVVAPVVVLLAVAGLLAVAVLPAVAVPASGPAASLAGVATPKSSRRCRCRPTPARTHPSPRE